MSGEKAVQDGDSEMFQAIEAALDYDYLLDKDSGDSTPAGIVKSRLTSIFKTEVLVKREIVGRLATDMADGRKVILIGANGCGKTAALISLNQMLRDSDAAQRVDLIVFNGNRNEGSLRRLSGVEERTSYILDKLARAALRRVTEPKSTYQLSAAFSQYLTETSSSFDPYLSRYGLAPDGHYPTGASEAETEAWLDAQDRWKAKPPIDRLPRVLSFLRLSGWKCAIAIDNCDFLDDDDLEAAADAARAFAGAAGLEVGVIVAARPSTEERVRQRMNIGPTRDRYVNSLERRYGFASREEADGWEPSNRRIAVDLYQTYEIFVKRLRIFDDPIVQAKLQNLRVSQSGKKGRDPRLSAFRNVALRVLTDYFAFDGRELAEDEAPTPAPPLSLAEVLASIEQQPEPIKADLTRVFAMWHNGSVRELALSLKDFVLRSQGPRLFSESTTRHELDTADISLIDAEFSKSSGANPRTALFRHLLFYGTRPDNRGFPILHPSCRLLEAIPGSKPANFGFPLARILQYLETAQTRAEHRTVDDVLRMLSDFDVDDETGLARLRDLSWRKSYGTGLIRVDGQRFDKAGKPIIVQPRPNAHVEIMPAGVVLISRVVYVIEYEYWSAVADQEARQTVCDSIGVTGKTLVSPEHVRLAANRIAVAITYLADVLCPRFIGDHPYMRPRHLATRSEYDRLHKFADRFGFGHNDWHVTRATTQIERFILSGSRPEDPDETSAAVLAWLVPRVGEEVAAKYVYLLEVSAQLDRVFEKYS